MVGVALSPELARRFLDVVERVEQTPRNPATPANGPGGAIDLFPVRLTSTSQTSGRYPGKRLDYDIVAKTFSDGNTIWVVDVNAATLATGTNYLARRYGSVSGVPVYIVDSRSAAAASVYYDYFAMRPNSPYNPATTGLYSGNIQFPSGLGGNWLTTVTPTPNVAYLFPILIPTGININAIANWSIGLGLFQITKGSSGAKARVALYPNETNPPPFEDTQYPKLSLLPGFSGSIIADSGDVPMDGTGTTPILGGGNTTGTGFLGLGDSASGNSLAGVPGYAGSVFPGTCLVSSYIPGGYYWLGIVFNNVTTMPVVGAALPSSWTSQNGLLGQAAGPLAGNPWDLMVGMSGSHTYGAWPSSIGSIALSTLSVGGGIALPVPCIAY